jgi:predicted RNA-binding protein YlxR (DUF448 family)
VRGPGGEVAPDPGGMSEGRGAYVCGRAECAEAAGSERTLARSFRAPVKVQQETLDFIREWQRSAYMR